MPRKQQADCILLFTFLGLSGLVGAVTRTYHIGIVEEYWNYVPQGKNVITGRSFAEDKHYTDETYSTEIPKPPWLGFLGPILRAEVGDVIVIHLKNFASRPYSLHPHGVFYNKDSEGALYPDGTSGRNKDDDMVPPGKNYTYIWPVREEYAPAPADANCLTWVYHSHIDAPKDICSGLIGPLLVCKEGTRTDVDREFVIMFTLVDENQSWYLDENIRYFCTDPDSVDKEDAVFQRSNKMHALNGYLFGNFPEPEMCVGESVSWHLFGMGNEIDIHSIYFYGNTFISRGHRTDVVNLFPATFLTTEMIAQNPGKWMITCQVSDHLQAGMLGQYNVGNCKSDVFHPKMKGQRRRYFIAAEKILWDYGPQGYNKFSGLPLNASGSESELYFTQGDNRIGGKYWKAKYVEYIDETFTRRKRLSEAEAHLGILGPVIKAEVGDTLLVTFANKADKVYSILPHGVKGIDKEFYLLFTVFDENLSRYLDENIQKLTWRPFSVDKEDKEFVKSNRMHAINGYMYGNQPGLTMCKKDRVSWHLIGMGTDTDMHGVYFQGNTIHLRGTHRDSLALFPHVSTTAFMQPGGAGIFRVLCSTLHHFERGMSQIYEVSSCGNRDPSEQPYGMIRTFYIAAEEVEWDYAPNKNWEFEKQPLDAGGERHGDIFMNHTENWIGSQYKKVVYREYTNGEFVEIKARPPREEHLALLGPMIHAEVGDSVLIVFMNKAKRPYSISAQGVEEADRGKGLQVPVTKPGEIKTYRWNVPKRSGPGPSDPNCIPWVYYSTVNFVKDTYSGLMGPLITCREGVLNEKGRRSDVDYEFVLLFLVFNENESWYLDDNIKKYLNKDPRDFKPSDDFEESNKMHGTWLLHCHVSDHIHAGMETTYTVLRNIEEPGKEQLYFFGKNLGPRGAKAALVILFIIGFLLLIITVILSFSLCLAKKRVAYQEVQSCALPTDAL
ncbi:Hephaestin-like protein 1 [Camelus dromedarius]|uniref:ferroxidase n=1 Tax=Camelus dromedarius TaxID=9838 RepID=A0A5N4DLG2_CAMDR|nr:Hephaestin-like protein 1 [Camelus dromedarius]